MIRPRVLLLAVGVLGLLSGCSDSTTDSLPGAYTVSGRISFASGPVAGATVRIDSALNWTATTSASGTFEIRGVSRGDHSMQVQKTTDNGSFTENSSTLSVFSDVSLDSLLLPEPILCYDLTEITGTGARVAWQPTTADDFHEYKVYRRGSPGLDETTGELVYVATARLDTAYTDSGLLSGATYYYRVYVMNDHGRLGGSNIVHAATIEGNLVPDGGFEDTAGVGRNWSITRSAGAGFATFVQDSLRKTGNSSLYNHNPGRTSGGPMYAVTEMRLTQPLYLIPNTTYRLSGWLEVRGIDTDIVGIKLILERSSTQIARIDHQPYGYGAEGTDWTYVETTFFLSGTDPAMLRLLLAYEEVWVDDLKLEVAH